MKRRKVTVAVLSVVLAAAALTGCGSAQRTNGQEDQSGAQWGSPLCFSPIACGNRRRIF